MICSSMSSNAESSNAESSNADFQCPVCRARQVLTDSCRRCKADLSLLARLRQRAEFLQTEWLRAVSRGDQAQSERIRRELTVLAPRLLPPDRN